MEKPPLPPPPPAAKKKNKDSASNTKKERSSPSAGPSLPSTDKTDASMVAGIEEVPKCSLGTLSDVMTKTLGNAFYRYGLAVSAHPYATLALALVFLAAFAPGLLFWKTVTDKVQLWTPYGSKFLDEKRWIDLHAPVNSRREFAILAPEEREKEEDGAKRKKKTNVLTPAHMQYLLKLDKAVAAARGPQIGRSYEDVCLEFKGCIRVTLLEAWRDQEKRGFVIKEDEVAALKSEQDVTDAINAKAKNDKTFNYMLTALLGRPDLTVGQDGIREVKSAEAILNIWLLKENATTDVEGLEPTDPEAEDWELGFEEAVVGVDAPGGVPEGTGLYGAAKRSFLDEFDKNVNSNLKLLFVGCTVLLLYVTYNLGRPNLLEQRIALSLLGMAVIGMSVASSYGFCFYVGSYYADVHPIIPFLLLGIGVDDMFIILRTLANASSQFPDIPPEERVGLAMKYAGVSISITSLTDLVAFMISASTSMPILRAFCFFCCMGILFLYFYTVTFFAACVYLDEKRIAERRIFPFTPPLPPSYEPYECSRRDRGVHFVKNYYTVYLLKTPVKILVLFVTVCFFCLGVYGATQLQVDYDAMFYMRESSFPRKFAEAQRRYFPQAGVDAIIYVGPVDYWTKNNRAAMRQIGSALNSTPSVSHEMTLNWFDAYEQYCGQKPENCAKPGKTEEEAFKSSLLTEFVRDNTMYGGNLVTDIDLMLLAACNPLSNQSHLVTLKFDCGEFWGPAGKADGGKYELLSTRILYTHRRMGHSDEEVSAMEFVKGSMAGIEFEFPSGSEVEDVARHPMVYSRLYMQWEASWTIAHELLRNVLCAFIVAIVVSLVLLASVQIALVIMVSVMMTLVNCAGFVYFRGYTVEIVTSMLIILSCGLALDYSAHVGVAYLAAADGSGRDKRARYSLVSMGTAIFHGGASSFIAIFLLCTTDSYVFQSFFSMFTVVICFGLFHGLCFLPVVLSLVGPLPN